MVYRMTYPILLFALCTYKVLKYTSYVYYVPTAICVAER